MKKYYLLIVCLILIGIQTGQSQGLPKVLDKNNLQIKDIAQTIDKAGWVFFKKGKRLSSDEIFVKYKDAFGLGKSDEMIKVKTKTDEFGLKHITYQQYYKRLPVEHYTYLIHEKGGFAEIANGELLENIDIDITPTLSPDESFIIALNNFKSNKWAWEEKTWEDEKRTDKINPSWKPKGELMIIDHVSGQKKTGVLVYKFDMFSIDPYFHYAIYINSTTGIVEKKVSLLQTEEGTVNTLYNGTQSLTTLYRGLPNWDYILKDETRGYICTKEFNNTTWNLRAHIDNHENLWHNSGTEVNGATAQWTAEKTYDYYHDNQNRHGIDDNNLDLRIHLDPSFNNAMWEPSASDHDDITIGQVGSYFLAALDVMGHEYTHGVVYSEAGLVYEKEPGALNESFADIFGTMVEKYVESSTWDWTLGEDVFYNDYLRSMSDPHARNQPSTYLTDNFWIETTNCTPDPDINDNCGVHTNSGVQNHWFYLLSQAIGTDKAARIAYYNLCYYLSEQSGYLAARNGSIWAASSLYGACSDECQQVMNAWASVGVGEEAVPCLSASITGPHYLYTGEPGSWYPSVSGGTGNYSYTWTIFNSFQTNDYMFEMTFDNEEQTHYTIGLLVEDEYFSDYDEIDLLVSPFGGKMSSLTKDFRLNIYPNPASNITTLQIIDDGKIPKLSKDDDIAISIVDQSGRVLYETITKNKTLELNVEYLQKGVYTIISSTGKIKSSAQLIIEK
jgi:bacillolysin